MPHRGRLNVLAHVLNKPYEVILSEFEGTIIPQDSEGDGDVKYHLGYANDRPTKKRHHPPEPQPQSQPPGADQSGRRRDRPGQAELPRRHRPRARRSAADARRCRFHRAGDRSRNAEPSELPGYRTGGTIHVIVNNQIGFTTSPMEGRFTPYPDRRGEDDSGADFPREWRRSPRRSCMPPAWRSNSANGSSAT